MNVLHEIKIKKRKEENAARCKVANMQYQLHKHLRKNVNAETQEITDPELRHGKLETPVIEKETKPYEEKIEANINLFHEIQIMLQQNQKKSSCGTPC